MFEISLKNNLKFSCSPQDSILQGAEKSNVLLDHSCKIGRCKSCKAKAISGTTIAINEEVGLDCLEKKEGYILTCVRQPTSDLVLDLEDLGQYTLSQKKTIPAKISKISKLSTDVVMLQLRLPPSTKFWSLPGQYVNIIRKDIKRSYSVANCRNTSSLEFFIKLNKGGEFSSYLFNEAKLNDLLRIEGPLGTFFLRESKQKYLIFMSTGTGIAPVKAILDELELTKEVTTKIYLFWGGRKASDLFWEPRYEFLDIEFVPVLSRASENWKGEIGYVQEVLIKKKYINLKESVVYACGSMAMINSASDLLLQHGLNKSNFYSDTFISTN